MVESSSGKTSQGIIFFGREKTLNIRVVVKQFSGVQRKQIAQEIKVLSEIEKLRRANTGSMILEVKDREDTIRGFPHVLSYKVTKAVSEIMMTHEGSSTDAWMYHIKDNNERLEFASAMLEQMIPALQTLHDAGYSHGDLKPDNVCARLSSDGSYRFTLIDFGVSQKLLPPGIDKINPTFHGNLLFCSKRQLNYLRVSRLCDLMALTDVGYCIFTRSMPITNYLYRYKEEHPGDNRYDDTETFKNLRMELFDRQDDFLCSHRNPFNKLRKQLRYLRDSSVAEESKGEPVEIDYEQLVSLLPCHQSTKNPALFRQRSKSAKLGFKPAMQSLQPPIRLESHLSDLE